MKQFLFQLSHLGWGLSRLNELQALPTRRRDALEGALWVTLALPDGQTLMVLALGADLPDLAPSFQAYQDLLPLHRQVFAALEHDKLASPYLLLLGGQGAHLIDREEEDILIAASGREDIDDRLLPLLDIQSLSRGSLVAFPRKSMRQRARELADWTALWSARIGSSLDSTHGVMARFFDWLHLARLADENGVGPKNRSSFREFAAAHRPPNPVRFLEDHFRPLHGQWYLLQDGALKTQLDLVQGAAHSNALADCLTSYSLLSRRKFSSDVLAEAFADEELRLRSWRTSVVTDIDGLDDEEDARERPPDRWMTESLALDFDKSGYVLLLRAMDRLVESVRRYALDCEAAIERGERPGVQLDLLGESVNVKLQPFEAARHVLKHVLHVQTADAARAQLARVLLLARGAEWHGRLRCPDLPFPRVTVEVLRPPTPSNVATTHETQNWN